MDWSFRNPLKFGAGVLCLVLIGGCTDPKSADKPVEPHTLTSPDKDPLEAGDLSDTADVVEAPAVEEPATAGMDPTGTDPEPPSSGEPFTRGKLGSELE